MRNASVGVAAAIVVILAVLVLRPAPAVEGPAFAPPPTEDPPPSALWIGDGFTDGYPASNPGRAGYACHTSQAMGWTCNLDAEAGTGYVNNGRLYVSTHSPFKDRLPQTHRRYLADVIIVDGGRHDDRHPAPKVAAAAGEYLRDVRRLWPRAEIVVIAPYFMHGQNHAFSRDLVVLLEPVLEEIDALLIDPIGEGWIPPQEPPKLLAEDDVHPNEAGHRYLSQHLTKALRRLGLADVTATDKRGPIYQ